MPQQEIEPGSSASLIRHKLPVPSKIVLSFGAIIFVLGMEMALFDTKQYDLALVMIFVLGGLMLFIFMNHRGYRIAWDDGRVYMRDWGFRNFLFQRHPWHSLEYGEMVEMWGTSPLRPAPGVTRAMPFQVLEIASRDPNAPNISLYGSGLNDADLSELLSHLCSVRGDIMPDALVEFIEGGQT